VTNFILIVRIISISMTISVIIMQLPCFITKIDN